VQGRNSERWVGVEIFVYDNVSVVFEIFLPSEYSMTESASDPEVQGFGEVTSSLVQAIRMAR
jgi:hypothetical protein